MHFSVNLLITLVRNVGLYTCHLETSFVSSLQRDNGSLFILHLIIRQIIPRWYIKVNDQNTLIPWVNETRQALSLAIFHK